MSGRARLTWEAITLKLNHPFRLSTGVSTTRTAHWIRLENDQGWGEGTIPPYYHIEDVQMTSFWEQASLQDRPFPDDPADIPSWIGEGGPAPARAAIDLALHDRIGKDLNLPLFKVLGLPAPKPVSTAFTIAISSPEEMAQMAVDHAKYPVIKLKLGSEDDLSRVAAVRKARPDVRLYVDANAGWSPEEAVRLVKALAPYQIEMIEQPVPADDIEGLGFVQQHTDIPVVADESLRTLEDVAALARVGVQGINLKLMKLGGLAPTLEILKRGKELGLKIMLGCMAETSLGVTAMAHLTSWGDWFDLDAPLLIKNDPFDGILYDHAQLRLPNRSGIGVQIRAYQGS
ncbi:MAG: dipeptide epimerase [Anaerolineales bacterium]|nr:dipeptide epimerase [Anaerolineales bacterium]